MKGPMNAAGAGLLFWAGTVVAMPRLALVNVADFTGNEGAPAQIRLATTCPPSFEQVGQQCKLVNLYQQYDSLHDKGVGGTKTALPAARDGFSPQQIDLGRFLFFDPLLSANKQQACASCHQPDKGFTDGKAVSTGALGLQGKRSAPTLWNVGFLQKLFWDGRSPSLEQQAAGPLFAPDEMANTPEQLLHDLNTNPQYPRLFAEAFAKQGPIELSQVVTALAAFQSSLISLNSRYDHYAHGFHQALNETEIKGMNVFRSFVARCAECHTPPLFTNQQIAVIGTPEPEGRPFDVGAGTTLDTAKLRGGFKVPTLRNVALTAPYMHSGRFASLEEAAEFYSKGRGHAVPKGEKLLIHWHIWEPKLTAEENQQIAAFLQTLTDQSLTPQLPQQLPSGLALPAEIRPAAWTPTPNNTISHAAKLAKNGEHK
jgi:cytochrome c peroxidase